MLAPEWPMEEAMVAYESRSSDSPFDNGALARQLLQAGALHEEQVARLMSEPELAPEQLAEVLVWRGLCEEATILKLVAAVYQTRYVTTQRLERARIAPEILQLVPVDWARDAQIMPVLYDPHNGGLSVVTARPHLQQQLQQLYHRSSVRELRAYIALPSAIDAAIRKHYFGEIHAFADLRSEPALHSPLPAQESPYAFDSDEPTRVFTGGYPFEATPLPAPPQPEPTAPEPHPSVDVAGLACHLVERLAPLDPHMAHKWDFQRPLLEALLRELEPDESFCRDLKLAWALGLLEEAPSLLSLAEETYPQHRQRHRRFIESLASFALPEAVAAILEHRYERVDGRGFPGQLLAWEIPLGSKILALLDAFSEQTREAPPDAPLLPFVEGLAAYQGSLFEPELLEALQRASIPLEGLRRGSLPRMALCLPGFPERHVLESTLWKGPQRELWLESFDDAAALALACQTQEFDLVVLPLAFPDGSDGIEFVQERLAGGAEFVFVSEMSSQEALERSLQIARDHLSNSTSPALLAFKIKRILRQIGQDRQRVEASALSGLLEHIALPELLQMLSRNQSSGAVSLRTEATQGLVFLRHGEVVHAVFSGLVGEDALLEMLEWSQGSFHFDPGLEAPQQTLAKPLQALLLDLLRRLDEARRS